MTFAGFWIRFWAHWIDFALWNALEFALEWGVTALFGLSAFQEQVLGWILTLPILYLYYVEIPVRTGTTIGKRVFGIRVYDVATGFPAGRKKLTIRMASYLVSYVLIGAGFIKVLFDPKKSGLHDLIAGTAAVRKQKSLS